MKSSAIPRMVLTDLEKEAAQDRVKLATAAHRTLGYKKLALAIATPGALLFKLRELGMEPLNPQQVAKYKRSKEKIGLRSNTKMGITALVSLTVFLPLFVAVMNAKTATPGLIGLAVFFGIGTLGSAVTSLVFAIQGWGYGNRTQTVWREENLPGYDGSVPEHILAKAVEIKNNVPSAEFSVDRLVEIREYKEAPLPDPFLIVRAGTESYYLDVWDEKDYVL